MFLLSCFSGNDQQDHSKKGNGEGNTPHVTSNKTNQYQLVWSEEFNIDGTPDCSIRNYEIGNGCNKSSRCGWGIGQSQLYTNRLYKSIPIIKETYNIYVPLFD